MACTMQYIEFVRLQMFKVIQQNEMWLVVSAKGLVCDSFKNWIKAERYAMRLQRIVDSK